MANELPQTNPGNQQTPQKPEQPSNAPKYTKPVNQQLGKGSLVIAKYDYFKHDPYPLILVSGLYSDQRIGGINLHYLTFNYIKSLVKNYSNNRGFSYQLIKNDNNIVRAFRTYKRSGLKQGKAIDGDFLLNVLGTARTYSPNEIDKIRQHIQQQLRQQINPKAEQMTSNQTNKTVDALKQQVGQTVPTTPTIGGVNGN